MMMGGGGGHCLAEGEDAVAAAAVATVAGGDGTKASRGLLGSRMLTRAGEVEDCAGIVAEAPPTEVTETVAGEVTAVRKRGWLAKSGILIIFRLPLGLTVISESLRI